MATVLLVDDDPKIRDLLRLYIEREGHRALFAADGEQALEIAGRSRPDLVLLDVMLPGLDGFEVCRRIRDSSDVPILLLTARSGEGDKVVGLDMGADDYVVKPFSPRELMALSCSRRYVRRCASENCDAKSFCNFCWICAISSCPAICVCTALTRFATSSSSSRACFCAISTLRLVARKSASCPPSVMFIRIARA
jgi:DNA-binding response OmpR family regulator